MPNIAEFRQSIRSGLSRPNRWRVVFNFPAFAASGDVSRQASLQARTASMPPSLIGVIEIPFSGRILPVPGDRQYEEFTMNFIAVNDFKARDAFEAWSEGINGSESNTGLTNLDDFMRDLVLELLDAEDNVTKTYILKDAWPNMVGTGDLDQDAQDSILVYPVTLRYTSLESNTTR